MLAPLAFALLLAGPAPQPAPPDAAPAATASPPAEEPFLARSAATRGFRAGLPARAVLTPDGTAALFLRSGPRSSVQALLETDLARGTTRELATAERLLAGASASLTAAEQARLERQRITTRGITAFRPSKDGARLLVTVGGKLFVLERATGAVAALPTGGRPIDPRFSPDGRSVAYVVDHDLRVLDLATGAERAVTTGGTEEVHHGTAEFVAQEELGRQEGFWWSPDSRTLLVQETDEREVERFTIHDPLHPERPADTFRYPRPGRANARVRVGLVAASGGPITWVDWDRTRWPYLAHATWPERGALSLVVLDRAQQEQVVLAVDPATGATRVLVTERDEAWVNHVAGFPRWREDGRGFMWRTERNGAPEIEERDAAGRLVRTWVAGAAGLDRLVGFDARRRALWFTGGPDPTQVRLYRVQDAGAPREWQPSPEPASIQATLSEDGGTLLVSRSTRRGAEPPVAYRQDGTRLATLPSVAEPLPFPTRAEVRRVGPGEGLFTSLVRPRDAVPGVRLPVIVEVYGGPHRQQVHSGPDPMAQWIADQGFLVVAIDGRGTPRRGRAFERAIRGDFAGPALEDQVAGLRALAAEVPELDLGRVGITGWSFGGYLAALAVLRRPDVFRVAVAGAPVTEWLDYDTAYTERYLGVPPAADEAYRRSSLLPLATSLTRPLLLVHGTADDNVYFFHSLKLSQALLAAGQPHEVLALPGLTHLALSQADPALAARIWARMIGHLRAGLAR